MADTTNQNTPQAGITLAGNTAQQYAIKRLQMQRPSPLQRPGHIQPPKAPKLQRF